MQYCKVKPWQNCHTGASGNRKAVANGITSNNDIAAIDKHINIAIWNAVARPVARIFPGTACSAQPGVFKLDFIGEAVLIVDYTAIPVAIS
jgi:hypothetical protein